MKRAMKYVPLSLSMFFDGEIWKVVHIAWPPYGIQFFASAYSNVLCVCLCGSTILRGAHLD